MLMSQFFPHREDKVPYVLCSKVLFRYLSYLYVSGCYVPALPQSSSAYELVQIMLSCRLLSHSPWSTLKSKLVSKAHKYHKQNAITSKMVAGAHIVKNLKAGDNRKGSDEYSVNRARERERKGEGEWEKEAERERDEEGKREEAKEKVRETYREIDREREGVRG